MEGNRGRRVEGGGSGGGMSKDRVRGLTLFTELGSNDVDSSPTVNMVYTLSY